MSGARRFRIGAVHALVHSIQPTLLAFERQWPKADVAHLLDGSLYLDRSHGTANEKELSTRIEHLLRYSFSTGAEGILFTGSFFADAVKQARASIDIPIVASFDGLIAHVFNLDKPLHVIATAQDSATLLVDELEREASRRSFRMSISGQAVAGAMAALIAGDLDRHDQLVLDAVRATDSRSSVVFAQFSMERVLERSVAVREAPVIGPAGEGVVQLRRLLSQALPDRRTVFDSC